MPPKTNYVKLQNSDTFCDYTLLLKQSRFDFFSKLQKKDIGSETNSHTFWCGSEREGVFLNKMVKKSTFVARVILLAIALIAVSVESTVFYAGK